MDASILLDRNSFARAADDLDRKHQRLKRLAINLQAGKKLRALRSNVVALCDFLTLDFAQEERPGGFYEALKFCAPQLHRKVAQLIKDHHDIAATVWRFSKDAGDSSVRLQGLWKEVSQVAKKIEDHETHEIEITAQVLRLLNRSSFATAEEKLQDEHRRLQALQGVLQDADNRRVLYSAAEQLRKALIEHFADEERPGGFYDSLKACVPQHGGELAKLAKEHQEIAGAMLLLCHRACRRAVSLEALRRDAAQVLSRLAFHESGE